MFTSNNGTKINCDSKENAVFCKVKKGDKKGEFGIGVNERGSPELKSPKGDLELIKNVKDEVAEVVRVKGVEGAEERF